MNRYGFQEKIVVMGGAGDIGVECGKLLVAGGAHVLLVDPRAEALEAAAGAIEGLVTTHVSDLVGPESCAVAIAAAG